MKRMTRKTILFPPELYRRLEIAARRQGRSVGDLVRDAVQIQYGEGGVATRVKAVEALSRLDASIGEPGEIEAQIEKGATAE